jgi:hypothetical protein
LLAALLLDCRRTHDALPRRRGQETWAYWYGRPARKNPQPRLKIPFVARFTGADRPIMSG